MIKVFVLGGVSYDSIIQLDEFPLPIPKTFHHSNFKETIGSTGSGKALNLCRLGFYVNLHALIGDDNYGKEVSKHLKHPNLQFDYFSDPNGTQRHVNIMNKEGERISIFVNNSSDEPDLDYEQFRKPISESDYVVLNITNYSRFAIPIVKALKKPILTDLHDYNLGNTYHQEFIEAADYVFLSSDNLPGYKEFMYQLIDEGKELVVCTHGKGGVSALTKDGTWFDEPILKSFELNDSNGAGDAFFSGYLFGHSQNLDVQSCLKMGTITAGMCINSEKIYHDDLSPEKVVTYFHEFYS